MSRRSRSKDVAISLFSFQDIITSVSAIMILLVLILTLELLERVATKGMAAEDRRVARKLKHSVTEMGQQLEQLQRQAASANDTASAAAGFSAKETDERRLEATRQASALQEDLRHLDVQMRSAQAARRAAESHLVKTQASDPAVVVDRTKAMEQHVSKMKAANNRERERQQEAQKQDKDSSAPAKTLVFNAPPGTTLKPLLVEISNEGLVAVATDGSEPKRFGWGLLGPSTEFEQWLKARNKTSEYIVIILRPSGVDRYDAVHSQIVSEGLDIGTELIGEEMSLVLGPPTGDR